MKLDWVIWLIIMIMIKKNKAKQVDTEWYETRDPIERYEKYEELQNKLSEKFGFESSTKIKERCQRIIDTIIKSDKQKFCIVTHSGIIEHMMCLLFNLTKQTVKGRKTGNCNIMYITWNEKEKFKLISAPTNEHLDFVK